jgi:hypothetical protein
LHIDGLYPYNCDTLAVISEEVVMSNSVAVPNINPIFNEQTDAHENATANEVVQKPVLKVVPSAPAEPPTLEELVALYAAQHRECWLCEGISKKIAAGREISEDDSWHFTSCVLSWEQLHRN